MDNEVFQEFRNNAAAQALIIRRASARHSRAVDDNLRRMRGVTDIDTLMALRDAIDEEAQMCYALVFLSRDNADLWERVRALAAGEGYVGRVPPPRRNAARGVRPPQRNAARPVRRRRRM